MIRYSLLVIALLLASTVWAQDWERWDSSQPIMVVGPKNLDLHKGAELLLAGRTQEGVERTLRGMQAAAGIREEEAALSNLCSGYVVLERLDEALKYCELLLERNDKSWRAYNNRALIYIMTEQYEKANQDLIKAPQKEHSRERVLTDDEIAAIWKHCDETGWPYSLQLPSFLVLLPMSNSRLATSMLPTTGTGP